MSFVTVDRETLDDKREVTYNWLPDWAYIDGETYRHKMSAVRYDEEGYTVIERIEKTTYFDK